MKRNIYEGYRPRAKGEQRFVDKHVVYHNPDNEGNGDDVFKASNIKKVDRKAARLGYEPGEDEKVYEASEEPTHIVVFEKGHRVGARSRRNVHVSANGENHAIKLAKNEFPDHKEQGYRIKEVHDLNESILDESWGTKFGSPFKNGTVAHFKDHVQDWGYHQIPGNQKMEYSVRVHKLDGRKPLIQFSAISPHHNFSSGHFNIDEKHPQHAKLAKMALPDLLKAFESGKIDKVHGYGQHLDINSDGSGNYNESVEIEEGMFGKKKPKITVTRRPSNEDPLYPKMVAAKKADMKSESVEDLEELAGPAKGKRSQTRRNRALVDKLYSSLPAVQAKVAAEREAAADENKVVGFQVPHTEKPGGKPEVKASRVPMGFRKEDIINKAINRYLPENHFTRSREDRLIETVSVLPESMARTLISLYESLDEDNKAIMIDACASRKGIDSVLDFAIREGRE